MDDAQETKRGISWRTCIVVLFFVLVLYVLSAGPVAYILERKSDYETWEWLYGTVYRPIYIVVIDAGYGFYLVAYVEWWTDLADRRVSRPGVPPPTTAAPPAPVPVPAPVDQGGIL